jgi:hypothetical protein
MKRASLSTITRAVNAGELLPSGWLFFVQSEIDRSRPDNIVAQPVHVGGVQDQEGSSIVTPDSIESPRADLFYLIVRCGEIMDTRAVPCDGRWILFSPKAAKAAEKFEPGHASRERHYAAFIRYALNVRNGELETLIEAAPLISP